MAAPELNPETSISDRPVVALTIGVDGRIYCHDLTPELLALLADLCVPDGQLQARQAVSNTMEQAHG